MARASATSPDELDWVGDAKVLSTHPRSWVEATTFMSSGILLMAAAIFFAILFIMTPNFAPPPGNYLAAAGSLAVGGAILGYQIYKHRPRLDEVVVYRTGVAWCKDGAWDGVPWGKLKRVYRSEVKVNSMWQTRELRLEWGDDETVVIPATIKNWVAVATMVQDRQAAARWPKAQESFDAGKAVNFGPISVSRAGVRTDTVNLSWPDVKQVHLMNGAIWIEAEDGADGINLGAGEIANFPNFYRLIQLATNDR